MRLVLVEVMDKDGNVIHTMKSPGDYVSFGRDVKSCKIKLPVDARGVSRIHTTLKWNDHGVTLTDTSSFGTVVGGTNVKGSSVELEGSTKIGVGLYEYQVVCTSEEAPSETQNPKKRPLAFPILRKEEVKKSRLSASPHPIEAPSQATTSKGVKANVLNLKATNALQLLRREPPAKKTSAKRESHQPDIIVEDASLPRKQARRGPTQRTAVPSPIQESIQLDEAFEPPFTSTQLPSTSEQQKKNDSIFEVPKVVKSRPAISANTEEGWEERPTAKKSAPSASLSLPRVTVGALSAVASGRKDEESDEDEKPDVKELRLRFMRKVASIAPNERSLVRFKDIEPPKPEPPPQHDVTSEKSGAPNFKRFHKASQGVFNKSLPQFSRHLRHHTNIDLVDFRKLDLST
ncbi:unnamed protein product [Caenorhabditis auriculariae]|uniref:FHA domain-containing protein n=1 Tax=Caenorhabditis auriculariae TaxID=2777116 RepID=A0A8S1HCM9_9PELO|nr:unnamed protein product [Caenorhabditis auriculariae]